MPTHSLDRYLEKRDITLKDYIEEDPFKLYFKYCDQENIGLVNRYRKRDEIFLHIFSDKPELYKAYKSIVDNKLIIPESLFFTSLGISRKNFYHERRRATIKT